MSGTPRPGRMATLLAVALLGGCASKEPPPPPAPPACPSALILQGAERTASFSGGATERPEALEHLAVVTNLSSACRFDDAGVDIDLAFDLIAERGPALAGDAVELTFFVATLAASGEVLAKQLLSSEIAFENQEPVAGVKEQLTYRLPSVAAGQGQDYMVFVGFQLDQAELDERLRPLLQ